MKTKQRFHWIGLAAVLMVPAVSGLAQVSDAPATSAGAGVSVQKSNSIASTAQPLPSNAAEMVKLSEAGLGDDVLLAYVNRSPISYNLSANDVVQLKDAGVSLTVIKAMLNHGQALRQNLSDKGSGSQGYSPGETYSGTVPVPAQPAPTIVETVPVSPPVTSIVVEPDYYWAPGYWGLGWGWGGYYGGYRGWSGYHGGYGGYHGGGSYHGGGGFHGGGGHGHH